MILCPCCAHIILLAMSPFKVDSQDIQQRGEEDLLPYVRFSKDPYFMVVARYTAYSCTLTFHLLLSTALVFSALCLIQGSLMDTCLIAPVDIIDLDVDDCQTHVGKYMLDRSCYKRQRLC